MDLLWLATKVHGDYSLLITILMFITGVAGLFAIYYGIQSFQQASLLRHPIPFPKLENHLGKAVAVRGKPMLLGVEGDFDEDDHLWHCIEFQERYMDRRGRQSAWRTTSREEKHRDFRLENNRGERLTIHNKATEVHGAKLSVLSGTGTTAFGASAKRKKRSWLPATGLITVVGKVERHSKKGLKIILDPSAGMLITNKAPKVQAREEYIKGWLCSVAYPVVWLAIAANLYHRYAG